jgi:hypothetical protein
VDGKPGELLLQIFSENQLGPIFFEFIQRKGNEGFGEGNFKALFETMELDQMRRGVLARPKTRPERTEAMAVEPVVYGASERPPRGDYARAGRLHLRAELRGLHGGRPRHLPPPVRTPGRAAAGPGQRRAFIAALPSLGVKDRIPRFEEINERLHRPPAGRSWACRG